MVVTLIGFRGTGKSTIAAPLAERLEFDWVDADIELEERAGRTIKQIFDTDGEPEFRRLERETLVNLLKRENIVIAAGGGAPMNPDTFRNFQAAGPVIWLQASTATIENRLYGDNTTEQRRPNLTTSGGRSEIEELLETRTPIYQDCATFAVSTEELSPAEIVEQIVKHIEQARNNSK